MDTKFEAYFPMHPAYSEIYYFCIEIFHLNCFVWSYTIVYTIHNKTWFRNMDCTGSFMQQTENSSGKEKIQSWKKLSFSLVNKYQNGGTLKHTIKVLLCSWLGELQMGINQNFQWKQYVQSYLKGLQSWKRSNFKV